MPGVCYTDHCLILLYQYTHPLPTGTYQAACSCKPGRWWHRCEEALRDASCLGKDQWPSQCIWGRVYKDSLPHRTVQSRSGYVFVCVKWSEMVTKIKLNFSQLLNLVEWTRIPSNYCLFRTEYSFRSSHWLSLITHTSILILKTAV